MNLKYNSISKIINEEINKLRLLEAVNFNNLKMYANELNNSLGNIAQISNDNNADKGLRKFLYDFTVYCVQIIHAINRCIASNSLNEASFGRLSDYGINLPPELGGNLWSDAKQGYHDTKRFLQGRNGYNTSYGNANGKKVNSNSVQSVKLSVLLQNLPKWRQAYNVKNTQYNIANNPRLSSDFSKILGNRGIIENIQIEYNTQLRNAQGTNP